jgi:hypothetical protein
MPTAVTCTVPVARCTRFERLITAYIAGNRPGDACGGWAEPAQHPPGAGGVEIRLDRPKLIADVGYVAQVSVADDVHQPEWSLHGGHLDEGLNVDVSVLHQTPAPVPVGVHLGMSGRGSGDRCDNEGGQRQRRVVRGEQTASLGQVNFEQTVHGHDPAAGPHGCGD